MTSIQRGFWSGVLATGPMTLLMFRLQDFLPQTQKSPLPPATLTAQTAAVAGIKPISENRQADLTLLNHFAYGSACGVAYALAPQKLRVRPVVSGSLFGILVWAVSYLGWTPLFGFRATAYKMPMSRNMLMIVAHIIWGASLGFAENEMARSGNQMLSGERKSPRAE